MTTTSLNLTLSLNDIALDPSKAQGLSPIQAQDMLCKVTGLIPILMLRTSQIHVDSVPPKNELITVKQAAGILDMKEEWIYRNQDSLSFVVKVGGSIRINQVKLNKAINEGRIL
jgi:hypothetical protein